MSNILRANEYRQIERLSVIKNENEKLLKQLQHISKGRELAVGHHKVHSFSTRQKTLHMDKVKKDAERIDMENNKILKAILRV
jgi:hypothetical protein